MRRSEMDPGQQSTERRKRAEMEARKQQHRKEEVQVPSTWRPPRRLGLADFVGSVMTDLVSTEAGPMLILTLTRVVYDDKGKALPDPERIVLGVIAGTILHGLEVDQVMEGIYHFPRNNKSAPTPAERPPRPSEKSGAAEAANIAAKVTGKAQEPVDADLDLDFQTGRNTRRVLGEHEGQS